jgi:hypothetical protein
MKTMIDSRPAKDGKAISLRCPECGQKLRTGPHNLGRFVRCSTCWHKFQVQIQVQALGAGSQSRRSPRPPLVDDPPLNRRSAQEELRALEAASRARLETIGAAAQAAGDVPSEHAAALREVLDAIEARIDCFNALGESRAPRWVIESARKSLARLAARRDRLLGEMGRHLIASGTAAPDQARTIEHIDARIETLRAWLGSRRALSMRARLAIVAGIVALLLCGGWVGTFLLNTTSVQIARGTRLGEGACNHESHESEEAQRGIMEILLEKEAFASIEACFEGHNDWI